MFISYWVLPAFAACMWCSMLMGMLITWALSSNRHLPSMGPGQHIAYISDIGAFSLKPLFITGSVITVVCLDLGIFAERWLRHNGRLAKNTSMTQKILNFCAILFAIAGAVGLILLSIFDTYRHHVMHDICLLIFIGGYIISAIFLCAEYQRLGIHYRQHRVLALSFWIKLAFIFTEVILAIVFASTSWTGKQNVAAVFEWTIAFIYTFWVLSFVVDLWPGVSTKHHIPQGHKDIGMTEQGYPNDRVADSRFSQQSTRHHSLNDVPPVPGANKTTYETQAPPRTQKRGMRRFF